MNNKTINIFVASPSDVREEREIVKEVCEEYNRIIGDDFTIKAHLYEDYPLSFTLTSQEGINRFISPAQCDIVIVILWKRMGTILYSGFEGSVTKEKYVTGTRWEFEKALSAEKLVFLYLKTEEKSFLENELDEVKKQKELRESFFRDIGLKKGTAQYGYHTFKKSDDFRKQIRKHLRAELEQITLKKLTLAKKINSKFLFYVLGVVLIFFISFNSLMNKKVEIETEKQQNIYQDIRYSRILFKDLKIVGSNVEVILKLKSLDKKKGVAISLRAKDIRNYQKIFHIPSFEPKLSKLTDENGNIYSFKSSTLKFGELKSDWIIVQPNGESLLFFTFKKEGVANIGKKFNFTTLFNFVIGDYQNKREVVPITVYLKDLAST